MTLFWIIMIFNTVFGLLTFQQLNHLVRIIKKYSPKIYIKMPRIYYILFTVGLFIPLVNIVTYMIIGTFCKVLMMDFAEYVSFKYYPTEKFTLWLARKIYGGELDSKYSQRI